MEIRWRTVKGSQEEKPDVIDKTSSEKYVYLHRNIERITQTEDGGAVHLWQYDEAVVTHEDYEKDPNIATEVLQAEIDRLETKLENQNLTNQANVEYIAMMSGIELEV